MEMIGWLIALGMIGEARGADAVQVGADVLAAVENAEAPDPP